MNSVLKSSILFFFFVCVISLHSQASFLSPTVRVLEFVSPIPDTLRLEEKNIYHHYFKVFSKNLILQRDVDYLLQDGSTLILFHPENYENITIEYAVFPERLFQEIRMFEPFEMSDTLKIAHIRRDWESLLVDNQTLNISGNKSISISASNHENLDINQSLFLRIDGELSNNVFIQAQLNDSQSPITPEGNTREISSLDEVFFKIYGREYEIAFGDLDLNITGKQFFNYNPQFEGIRLSYFDNQSVTAAIAVSSSRSAYVNLSGKEGNQGPYFLRPDGSFYNVKILPGSETIWLNGTQIYRGNDYRIDYNEGSIEFTLRHFISENSRIQASFQYSDEYYRKNSLLANTDIKIFDNLKFTASAIYQRDDSDKPISESLSDEDKAILKVAGDKTPFNSGEIYIGYGFGLYKKVLNIDLNSRNEYIFVYAPGEDDADYNVKFTSVGAGNGDYSQITPSRFDYVGDYKGSFLPIREIVPPQHRANYNFSLNYNHDILNLYAESLFSEYDKNTLSEIDNDDNFSQIHHLQLTVTPDWDKFEPTIRAWYRYRQRDLFTFANFRNPEDIFMFNNIAIIDSLNANELSFSLNTRSFEFLNQETSYRYLNFQNEIKQSFLTLNQSIRQTKYTPFLSYRFNLGNNKNNLNENNNLSTVTVHEPSLQYRLSKIAIQSNLRLYESKEEDINTSKISHGNRFNQFSSQFVLDDFLHSGLTLSFTREDNFAYTPQNTSNGNLPFTENGEWLKERKSDTWTLQTFTRYNRQSVSTLFSHRIVQSFNDELSEQKFDIAELRTLNSLFNSGVQLATSYLLKNTEFYPLARELVYVGTGIGFYDSTGVWTENGDWDWDVVIVGEPTKSIELQTNLSAHTYPANFFPRESELFDFFNKINLETNVSISEQTENRERLKVYLMFPSAIKNDLSIYSRQEFRQTVWYNIQRNKWVSRYSFRNNSVQDRRYQYLITNSIYEHELSIRLLRVYNSDFEKIFRFANETDSRYEMETDTRANELNIRTTFTNNLIFNTGLGYETETVISRSNSQNINRYILTEDILYFLGQRYRLNANVSMRYNVINNQLSTYLPHDKQAGLNLRWMTGINYRINRISTINFDYSGYKHPNQDPFHQIRTEARVEF